MRLLVGLGNPGSRYVGTRHNVGFLAVDALAKECQASPFRGKADVVEISSFYQENEKILLAKPQTFMNFSGRAVHFLIDFYKVPINRVYVFHDDLDLEFGRTKIKKGGGNGGHNGLKNIDELVGNDYWRIRIGIGRPEQKSMVISHVLSDFLPEEVAILNRIIRVIGKNIRLILSNDVRELEARISAAKAAEEV
ncbi:MAG: aminoacyl-tRNA hydrolase [Holosporaceae bacterium]|jgi:PTH1 family peptidyl-tRNA hydrolase|nr:aminoacyl-tRNA hydrolase [Holosporaceae bacterium]